MKILHVIDHFGLGGAQSALPDLLAAWPEPADEIHVLGLGQPDGLRHRFEALPQVALHQLGLKRREMLALGGVARRIRNGGFDIVHAHLAKSIVVSLMAQGGSSSRLVVHLRAAPRCEHWLARGALRLWKNRVDAFIAVSQATADEAQRRLRISRSKLFTVYNCLETQRLLVHRDGREIRSRLGWPANVKIFGYCGRLHREKGLFFLIEAMAEAMRQRPDLGLVLLGNGPLEPALKAAVRRRGIGDRVRFVGLQHSLGDWIGEFTAAVLPSLTEGLPMSLVEVQAAGRPVIATAVGGTPEIIEDEINGLLVPPADAAALSRAMLRIAASPQWADDLGRCGKRQIAWMFSPAANSRRVRAIYAMADECVKCEV